VKEKQLDFEDLLVRQAMEREVQKTPPAPPAPAKPHFRLFSALKNLGRRRGGNRTAEKS
jgi:hypothetical protein